MSESPEADHARMKAAARIAELETDVTRLQRKIAAGPFRAWIENDDPEVIACMGSVPACARNGCQARLNVPLAEQIGALVHRWEKRLDGYENGIGRSRSMSPDEAGTLSACVEELSALLKEL